MTDREQIIKDFEHAINKAHGEDYDYFTLTVEYADKILKLLEAQPDIVRCKKCIRRGTYNCPIYIGGDADHGSPDDWFCADGERMPELGDNETSVMSKIIQDANDISSRIMCRKCGQELRKHTDLYCPHCGRRVMWKLSGFWEESEEGITYYD